MCLILLLLCAAPVAADVTDFIVNDDGGATEQNNPRIAVAGDGRFAIVWTDKRSGQNDIYLQRFTADGTPLGLNQLVNTDTNAAWQTDPAIASDYTGLNSIVWRDYRTGSYPFDADIFFQRYDSALSPSGDNRLLTTELPDSLKEAPDISLSRWGSGVVVWADYRNRHWDIYGQLIAADGSLVGDNFKVNDDIGIAQQHAPRVAYAAEGWFVVTWYDNRLGQDDIFVQRFDSLGNKLGGNVLVNSDGAARRQAFPAVATDGRGHFTVVWVDWRNGVYPANPDIYAKKFDTAMVPVTADLKINTDNTSRAQREPSIAADRMGNVAIIWSDSVTSSFDIVGQMIDVDGVVREFNFQANEFTDSAQLRPDVALDGQYRYVTWADKRNGHFDVYASITQYNDPTLAVAPEQLIFSYQQGGSAPASQQVSVSHSGLNPINFTPTVSASWLNASPTTAQSPAAITITIDTSGLDYGAYFGSVVLVDTDNSDSSVAVTVRLDVLAGSSSDSLVIGMARTAPGASGVVFVDAFLGASIEQLLLPFSYAPDLFTIDSIVLTTSLPAGMVFDYDMDSAQQAARLWLDNGTSGASLGSGYHPLAEIYYTGGLALGSAAIDALAYDTNLVHVVRTGGERRTPTVIAGEVIIDDQTAVGDGLPITLPTTLALSQNYPNPFNASTTIEYSLPEASFVELEIFNILGQRVDLLHSSVRPAGRYVEIWDGRADGRELPTGIYFYRLTAGDRELIRKMLLLK